MYNFKTFIKIFGILFININSVILLPNNLQDEIFNIPFNGWSLIHLISTCSISLMIKTNKYLDVKLQYWIIVFGWEIIEQLICPLLFYNL